MVMIKKKITKNINTKVSPFQFEISQIIIGVIGLAVALGTYFLLRDYIVFDGLIWIILLELMLVVGFGIIKINDMSLIAFIMRLAKSNDRRPYSNRKGVFDEDDFDIF